MQLQIKGLKELLGTGLVVSNLNRGIDPEHRHLLPGFGSSVFVDQRQAMPYVAGDTVEPGLVERWDGFERAYLNDARISKFWHVQLDDAIVLPPHGIMLLGDTIIRDTVRTPESLRATFPSADPELAIKVLNNKAKSFEVAALGELTRVERPAYLLGYGMGNNYFNWTLRYMSRVQFHQLEDRAEALLAPAPLARFVQQGLEFMGALQDETVWIEGNGLQVDTLFMSSPSALGRYELAPFICHNLREHPVVEQLWDRPQRRLYIPRRNVKFREVVNEAAIEEYLLARGFVVLDSSIPNVRDQIAAFKRADVIVAPHGAGLSNIVYAAAGTRVLELIPEGYDQGVTSYRSLSDMFSLDYAQVFAAEVAPDTKGNRCNSDISVSLADIERGLGELGVD